jgi:dTDP-4-dehydrorhamnose 3,5-epimerase
MKIIDRQLNGLLLLEPKVWEDRRGVFFEAYNRRTFRTLGIDVEFVQDNQSGSRRGTLRGLHYQAPPHAQAKLLRVLSGEVFDVAVDLRRSSPSYGRWAAFRLSAANRGVLFIPEGFAHGFCVLSDYADVLNKYSDFYAPECERGLRWDDPAIGIQWPVTDPPLSDRDRRHPFFVDLARDFD